MTDSTRLCWQKLHEIRARELILQAEDYRLARIATRARRGAEDLLTWPHGEALVPF